MKQITQKEMLEMHPLERLDFGHAGGTTRPDSKPMGVEPSSVKPPEPPQPDPKAVAAAQAASEDFVDVLQILTKDLKSESREQL